VGGQSRGWLRRESDEKTEEFENQKIKQCLLAFEPAKEERESENDDVGQIWLE